MSGVKRSDEEDYGSRKRAKKVVDDDEELDDAIDANSEEEDEDDESEEDDEEDSDEEDEDEDENGMSAFQKLREEQRLVAESREMGKRIVEDRARAATEGGLELVTEHLQKINKTFGQQQKHRFDNKTLEANDARNLQGTSDLMEIAMRNIKMGTTRHVLKPDEFVTKMRRYLLRTSMRHDVDALEDPEEFLGQDHGFAKFNWFNLGTFAFTRGKKVPTTDHLLGPLEIERKVRDFKPRKRLETTQVVTTAEAVTSDDVNKNSNDHTTVAVQNCYKYFQELSTGDPINIFKFFINPNSFSQSVENMFYTSFLLRDGRLQLGEDEEGYPTVSFPPPLPSDPLDRQKELTKRKDLPSNHIIFQLEYDSWRKLIGKFHITESYLPERLETTS